LQTVHQCKHCVLQEDARAQLLAMLSSQDEV
jgi:hypothetical protein